MNTFDAKFLTQFIETLTRHYGATEAPAMNTTKAKAYRNPWATEDTAAYVFVTTRGHIRFGSSLTRSSYMSMALATRVAEGRA